MLLLCGFNTGASSRAASTLSLDIFLQVLERATGIEPVKPQLGRFCKIADLVKGHCHTKHLLPERQIDPNGQSNTMFSALGRNLSNIGELAEILVIFIVSSLPLAYARDAFHKFDRTDPFDHLEPELVFYPKPQGRAMQFAERFKIHLVGEQTLWMLEIGKRMTVVVQAAFQTFAKRMEDGDARIWLRPHQADQFDHRHSAPFGDARPALDTMVQGGVPLCADRSKIF